MGVTVKKYLTDRDIINALKLRGYTLYTARKLLKLAEFDDKDIKEFNNSFLRKRYAIKTEEEKFWLIKSFRYWVEYVGFNNAKSLTEPSLYCVDRDIQFSEYFRQRTFDKFRDYNIVRKIITKEINKYIL